MAVNSHPPTENNNRHHAKRSSDRTSHRSQLRCKRAAAAAASESRTASRRSGATSGGFSCRRLLAGALLCTVGALLVGPQLQTNNFQSVEGLKALKALAKTFVYQQLTQRKNFVPLPVPIPVPIEINEPPVYLKGKPKYVNVYKPKPTPAPVSKPTTVYHMPIYSPTYEYMSMDPMSSMYGHVAPVLYPAPYGKASLSGTGYKSASEESDASSYSSAAGSPAGLMNFNDYDDDSSHYYLGRSGRRPSKVVSGDYAPNDGLFVNQRKDEVSNSGNVAGVASGQHQDLATASSSSSNSAAQATPTNAKAAPEDLEENEEEDDEHSPAASSSTSASALPADNSLSSHSDDESYDHEQDSSMPAALRRSKRQISYSSGYNGKDNCEGLPIEVNVRSRIKLDRIFPIFGKSQLRKCVKPKKPFHILPPPDNQHY